jgi:hypothetical protein
MRAAVRIHNANHADDETLQKQGKFLNVSSKRLF